MAIEIRELIIRAVVDDTSDHKEPESASQKKKNQKQIIEESVDQTLKILDKKRER